jgi:hypothetical protein
MLRIGSGILMIWFCSGCVGTLFEPLTEPADPADKAFESAPKLVHDEDKPGRPVIAAYFSGAKVTDAELQNLPAYKELRILDLRNTNVSDAGLKALAGMTQLRQLILIGTKVTDAGLTEIATLKNLERLYLVGAKVTDAGLVNLGGLKQLRELNLSDTRVTYTGQRRLQDALPGCHIIR